jgi:7-cyano-7-deazaguanine synthase in queuosine biosynthesis
MIPMQPIDTLLFLSGGLDSSVALVRLLRETTDVLHVHYIYYLNKENRYHAERAAVEKIVPYCSARFRDFTTSMSVQDYREIGLPADMHVVRFTAAQICLKHAVKRIATGRCKDDNSPSYSLRLVQADAIFNSCIRQLKEKPGWTYPVVDLTKEEEVAYLLEHAPEVMDMIHYCRCPVAVDERWTSCGRCKTCRQMLAIGQRPATPG